MNAERTVVRGIKDLASIVCGWSSRRGLQDGVVDKEAGNPGRLQVVGEAVANKTLEVVTRSWNALLQVRWPSIKNERWKRKGCRWRTVLCCWVEGKRSYRHVHPDNWSLEVDELFLAGSRVPGGQ